MKTTRNTPKTGALGAAFAFAILAIAIAWVGYSWHRVVSAQQSAERTPPPVSVDGVLIGDGTFKAPVSYGAGTQPSYAAIGDFNGDGKPDVAVTNQVSNSVSILLGNGDGTFGAPVNFTVGTNPRSVAVGDFNGDGKVDLAVANFGNSADTVTKGTVTILLGNGSGGFSQAASSPYTVG